MLFSPFLSCSKENALVELAVDPAGLTPARRYEAAKRTNPLFVLRVLVPSSLRECRRSVGRFVRRGEPRSCDSCDRGQRSQRDSERRSNEPCRAITEIGKWE